jgi:hypothetical protein
MPIRFDLPAKARPIVRATDDDGENTAQVFRGFVGGAVSWTVPYIMLNITILSGNCYKERISWSEN